MKTKSSLKKLTLQRTTIAHLNNEQMNSARGGSTGGGWETEKCPKASVLTICC